MKKQFIPKKQLSQTKNLLLGLSLACGLCACGDVERGIQDSGSSAMESNEGISSGEKMAGMTEPQSDSVVNASGLRFLCEEDGKASCANDEGYYYLSTDAVLLEGGSYGSRLMYMDYDSRQEIYLCSSPGCTHDTPDCAAVLPQDEFPPYNAKLFLYQDSLYVLSFQHDPSGNSATAVFGSDNESFFVSGSEIDTLAVLYRMNLDGTGRQKVYTFDSGLTLEGTLAICDRGLLCIAQRLSAEETGTGSYVSSSERKLVCLNLASFEMREVCSLDFGDGITWRMIGCAGDAVVLRGTDYGRQLTKEEYEDDNIFRKYYENSSEVFLALDIENPVPREFYRKSNKASESMEVLGGSLYVGSGGSNEIIGVDVATGEERTVAVLPQNYIWGTVGNMLYCRDWNAQTDHTFYFIDATTGEVHHSGLVNKSLGWSLGIAAETKEDVLVIYDYDAVPSQMNEGGYEIRLYQYGLISKEDLYAGKDNYRKIQMVGKGF